MTYRRECLFGEIAGETIRLNPFGKIVQLAWLRLSSFFPIRLDAYMVMPNHFHGIIWLGAERTGEASAARVLPETEIVAADASPQPPKGTQSGSLGAIIQNFKSTTTRRANQMDALRGISLWQRNYYEHVVRNESELNRICRYILHNPIAWAEDRGKPGRVDLTPPNQTLPQLVRQVATCPYRGDPPQPALSAPSFLRDAERRRLNLLEHIHHSPPSYWLPEPCIPGR